MPKILLAYPVDAAAAILADYLATENITNEGRIAKKKHTKKLLRKLQTQTLPNATPNRQNPPIQQNLFNFFLPVM